VSGSGGAPSQNAIITIHANHPSVGAEVGSSSGSQLRSSSFHNYLNYNVLSHSDFQSITVSITKKVQFLRSALLT
jgi:hypothetical protein